jgi:hypothetical protein
VRISGFVNADLKIGVPMSAFRAANDFLIGCKPRVLEGHKEGRFANRPYGGVRDVMTP